MSRIRLESAIDSLASGGITSGMSRRAKNIRFAQKLMNVPSEMREKF